ncbi:hypothetical protein Pth03_74120 [Planotetraspora thailandica]|uniref:Uncharacterized protein n=1 Tax=Planotetraspora thailandica TaxID=487172 RepID=A0A8J4DEA6_9ACTN|nr:hypothetical protein [Planotetraspora thailandica]GII59023.1 hypothetical protein Pth03_74120 [Planotetraspora thailandica]
MSTQPALERRYRSLLKAYPKAYRDAHGEELLSTLMEASDPQARRPALREVFALVTGGFAARARNTRATGVPWWADGLHLGVLVVATTTFATEVSILRMGTHIYLNRPIWTLGAIVLMVAITRGWLRLALPLALIAALDTSRMLFLDGYDHGLIEFGPPYTLLGQMLPFWIIVVGLAVLAVRPGKALPARSWSWLLIPALFWVAECIVPAFTLGYVVPVFTLTMTWQLFLAGVKTLVLGGVVWATVAIRDARWALAAALYLLPGLTFIGETMLLHSEKTLAYWGVLTLLVLASFVAARRTRQKV